MPFLFRCHYSSFTKTNFVTDLTYKVLCYIMRSVHKNGDVICNNSPNARKDRWIAYGTCRWQRCQPYTPAVFTPLRDPWYSIAIMRPEGPHRESNPRPPASSAVQPPEPPRASITNTVHTHTHTYTHTHTHTIYKATLILRTESVRSSETSIMNCQLRVSYAPRKNASI